VKHKEDFMEITKLKENYERKLKRLEQDVIVYEASNNNELRIAAKTLKAETEELRIIVDALSRQIPIKASTEYDNEFTCPSCGKTTEEYDITTLKVCPECGQKLQWDQFA
jgi:rubrerythrin